MKKFIFVMAFLCLYSFTQAQQVGKPAGNNPVNNFFNTSASSNGGGSQLGHLQTGTFSNLTGNSEWISIGESNNGPFYGMRIQKGADFGTFSVNTDGSAEDLEILWGGSSSNKLNFKYAATATTPATNVMTLNSNGYVGIATTNPTATLELNGGPRWTSNGWRKALRINNANAIQFNATSTSKFGIGASSSGNRLYFFTTNVEGDSQPAVYRMVIQNNGNVGIGTTAPTQKLQVNGNILCTASYLSSDRRYKDKIENLQQPMDLLNSINGVSYEYKRGEFPEQDFKEGKSLGFVAQDFEKALPELLIQDEQGFYAVNYDGVIPILVEAVKELDQTKIQNLERENEAIRTENETIKNELSELKTLVKELIASQDQSQAGKAASNNTSSLNKSELFQNAPNPSNGNTEISYLVEGNANNIAIDIYDADGKMMQRFDNLPTGKNSVSLTENLQPGIYFYTLFTDGQEVATKRMVVMK